MARPLAEQRSSRELNAIEQWREHGADGVVPDAPRTPAGCHRLMALLKAAIIELFADSP
jgi:hypothetical protein